MMNQIPLLYRVFFVLWITSVQAVAVEQVAVMAFESTTSVELGETISKKFHQALSQIQTLNLDEHVYPREKIEQIRRKYGIRKVITGHIGRFRQTYIIDMNVIDTASLEVVYTHNASGKQSEMDEMVSQLVTYFIYQQEKPITEVAPAVDPMEAEIEIEIVPAQSAPQPPAATQVEPPKDPETQRWSLTVMVEPKQARIRVLNIKPKYHPNLLLPAGNYHIDVTSPGYKRHRKWVKIRSANLTLSVRLLKK